MVRLYCALYKQYDVQPGFEEDDFEEDEFAMPPKLSKATFETLAAEYLSLARIIHESQTRPWDSLHDVL